MIRLKEDEFLEIVSHMRDVYGINLDKKKILIECRLSKELEQRGFLNYRDYMRAVVRDKSGSMEKEMVNKLTTNYTYFMREDSHFTLLSEQILPELADRRKYGELPIWCAGCSSGEESYTLAMVLREFMEKTRWHPKARVLATDISEKMLEKARKGEYSDKDIDVLPIEWQRKYFEKVKDKQFRVRGEVRELIRFQNSNLLNPFSMPQKFDLILCRNVMIYFDQKVRGRLIRQLEEYLNPEGYLMIGHAELLAREETQLERIGPAVYKKKSSGKG